MPAGADAARARRECIQAVHACVPGAVSQLCVCFGGPEAAIKFLVGPEHWVDGPTPLQNPELHALLAPVLRDFVKLVVPLLLPECHDIALPATVPEHIDGSKLSALLPQQILLLAAGGAA